MLTDLPTLLRSSVDRNGATGAFTCYDLETASAVLNVAECTGRGVILLVAASSLTAAGGGRLVSALRTLAERSPAPVCVQLDHVSELSTMNAALEAGANALMADGSRLPFAENARLVHEAVCLAKAYGAHVEGELGRVDGDEDIAVETEAASLTEPDEAVRFASEAGLACLAISIGNVHGLYRNPPSLDYARLEAIRTRVAVPLSLHGASGLADTDIRRCIAHGVRKVNVNTELRAAYLDATGTALRPALDGLRVSELHREQTQLVQMAVDAKLALF